MSDERWVMSVNVLSDVLAGRMNKFESRNEHSVFSVSPWQNKQNNKQ
jgi:hypothetical protein